MFAHHEDVRGLQVAVDDPDAMSCRQALGHLHHQLRHPLERHRAVLAKPAVEIFAVQQLHHHERGVVVDAIIEHLDHVRAAHSRDGHGLALESFRRARRCRQAGGHELDGNPTL